MASQLREVRNALSIRAAELKYDDLWPGSIQKETKIYPVAYIAKAPPASAYTTIDPTNDSSKKIEEKTVTKEALYEVWKVEMKKQAERMMQYEINGRSLFHILKGQVDTTTIGKLEHKSKYNKAQDDEDVIGLLELLKESCSTN